MATARKLLPFRLGTRQRWKKIGVISYGANSTGTLELPRVGYLSRLIVQFRGTGTLSGAGALADRGPHSLVNRFRVTANIGAASLVDLTGWGAHVLHRRQRWGADLSLAGIGETTPETDIYTFPVAMGANTWALSWVLPISANQGKEFEFGLVNLQSPETRVQIDVVTGALTDAATLVTDIDGDFHVYMEYYEVPDPTKFAQPPLTLVRSLEERMNIGAVGENIYTFPRQGVLMQNICTLILNGARSDSFDNSYILFNKTDRVYETERQLHRIIERFEGGLNSPTGVFGYDLWNSDHGIGEGDGRDNIDLEELSTVEQVVTVSSGAALGANNNELQVVRRIAQRLVAA